MVSKTCFNIDAFVKYDQTVVFICMVIFSLPLFVLIIMAEDNDTQKGQEYEQQWQIFLRATWKITHLHESTQNMFVQQILQAPQCKGAPNKSAQTNVKPSATLRHSQDQLPRQHSHADCRALRGSLAKKRAIFSCPVFVLHKIWGLAALKGTQPKPKRSGSVHAAHSSSSSLAAMRSHAEQQQRGHSGAAAASTHCKIRMGWVQGRTSRDPPQNTTSGLQEAQQVQAGWSEAGEDGQHGVARVPGSSVEIVAVLCQWARPVSPSQEDERHLLV